jgi:hypothetical protein
MQLRVYRTFQWVVDMPVSDIPLGGYNLPYTLKATDTLQYLDETTQEWKPVSVEEAPKPPHPRDVRLGQLTGGDTAFLSELDDLMARTVVVK